MVSVDGGDGDDGDGGDGGRSSIVSAPASLRRSRHRPRSDANGPDLENERGRGRGVSAASGSLVGGAGVRHVGGNDPRVELLGRQEAEFEGGLAQR